MNDLFDILRRNPILLILLGGWLLSVLGNVMTRAARRGAEQQQSASSRTESTDSPDSRSDESDEWEPLPRAALPQQPGPHPQDPRTVETARSPQTVPPQTYSAQPPSTKSPSSPPMTDRDVAEQRWRELMRKLGMEPTTPEIVRPAARPAVEPRDAPVVYEEYHEPEHGVPGQLLEEMARKERARKVFTTDVERREVLANQRAADNVKQYFEHLPQLDDADAASVRRRRRHVAFDVRDARAGIIAREVLGDPRGLRPWQ